jgi:hypothetical protein
MLKLCVCMCEMAISRDSDKRLCVCVAFYSLLYVQTQDVACAIAAAAVIAIAIVIVVVVSRGCASLWYTSIVSAGGAGMAAVDLRWGSHDGCNVAVWIAAATTAVCILQTWRLIPATTAAV